MIKKFLSILSILCVLSVIAKAQSSTTETEQVDINLVNVITLKFVATGTSTGSAITLPISTLTQYSNGVESAVQQLTASSTKNFAITVKTNAANFTYTGSYTSGTTMPVNGKLKLRVTAQATGGSIAAPFSAYSTLTNTDQNLINAATLGNNKTFSIQYQATPGFGYPAGTYTTQVVYTATQL
jgi:hypothetical protein